MDRRRALKNIGLGAGFLVVTPTVMNLLQSCAKETSFKPLFLSAGQGHALSQMVDLIIPSDERIPGALDVGVDSFIDAYWAQVTPREQNKAIVEVNGSYQQLQQHLQISWKLLEESFERRYERELAKGRSEEFEDLLSTTFAIDKATQGQHYLKMVNFYKAYEKDPTSLPDSEAAIFGLLSDIRGLTIWAWKSSEQIGENVLWYDPIPGQQRGCIPLSEAGNGKAMSL